MALARAKQQRSGSRGSVVSHTLSNEKVKKKTLKSKSKSKTRSEVQLPQPKRQASLTRGVKHTVVSLETSRDSHIKAVDNQAKKKNDARSDS